MDRTSRIDIGNGTRLSISLIRITAAIEELV
jgi:hypothetical protein